MRRRALYKNASNDVYVFTVSNNTLNFPSSGGSQNVTVTSTKNNNNHPWHVVVN